MSNLVTSTPIPFDGVALPFTNTDSFVGAGEFLSWSNAGPYFAHGLLWRVCLNQVPVGGIDAANFLNVYSSADGGLTWAEKDAVHRPQLTPNNVGDAPRCDVVFGSDNVFYIVVALSGTRVGDRLSVQRFDTGTATWLAAFAGGPLISVGGAVINDVSIYQNSTNTDLLILYDRTLALANQIIWLRVTAGAFGAEHTLRASAANNYAGIAVVDSTDTARVFFKDAGTDTYQAINPNDTLGAAAAPGWVTGSVPHLYFAKPVIWQGVIVLAGDAIVGGTGAQPFALTASPATAPTVFTATQIFAEPVPSSISFNDSSLRLMIDGNGALWMAWGLLSHSPGGVGDPVTVSGIGMSQLCAPGGVWGNHQIFWDQLTDPQTDQPLNDPDALTFHNLSLSYIGTSDTFNGIVNIDGFNNTYAYYLRSTVGVSSITMCSVPPPTPPSPPTYWNPGSAVSLLCEKNYPWSVPPKERIPVDIKNSVPAPVANVLTEIWSYTVPDGMWFVFDTLLFQADVAGFVQGSGSLIFTLDVNSPTTGTALPVGRPIAKFTANVGDLAEPVKTAPIQLYQGDILRAKVLITDNTLGVGLPNVIHAAVEGWLFPHSRNI